MSDTQFIPRAAAGMAEIVHNIKPEQMSAPTPCTEYNVRAVLNHLLFWGPSLEGAARKEPVPPPAAADTDVDLTKGDWPAAFEAHLDRLVVAWSREDAWDGVTRVIGPTPLPAPLIGGMVMTELIVHGWDLARATGQHPRWDDDVLERVHREITDTAEQGRQMGAYGPDVAVPESSSTMDRLLGLTGREPGWHP